jgi:hypothetical protein
MSATSRKPRAAAAFTLEAARALILAKLAKAGAKGAPALCAASTAPEKRALLDEAAALLEAEQAILTDRRKARPRYYQWDARPALPTAASVAELLSRMVAESMPVVSTRARLKASLKKHKEEAPLFEPALAHLIAGGAVQVLQYPRGKKMEELFIPASIQSLASIPPVPPASFDPELALQAYRTLVARTGFPAVAISALRRESAAPLAPLQAWLRAEHQAGRAVLALGDWSLADSEKRQAAIEWLGQPHLLVRLLS